LVHVEEFGDVRCAIAREKEIKGWRREKKVWLIRRHNRTWEDLAGEIAHKYIAGEATTKAAPRKADPSPTFAKSRRPGLPAGRQVRDDNVKGKGDTEANGESRSLTSVRQRRATGFGMTA
jgi:hypothetical protein